MKIGELTRRPTMPGPLIGVEVEVEGAGLPSRVGGFRVVREGSLRQVHGEDGREYVFQSPVPLLVGLGLLDNLASTLYSGNRIVNFSNRTSVHVHVNVTDLTISEWFTYLFLWVLYEDALINFCGNERKGNLFCLSSRDAEGLMFTLEAFARDRNPAYLNDELRYCAVNTAATAKYGSVEFRCMRGTLDADVLTPWITTLVMLRDKAEAIGSPSALLDSVFADPEGFTKELFGDEHFIYNYPDWNRQLRENVFRCALIIDNIDLDAFVFEDEPEHDI